MIRSLNGLAVIIAQIQGVGCTSASRLKFGLKEINTLRKLQCINAADNKLREAEGFPNTDHWGNTDPTIIYHGSW